MQEHFHYTEQKPQLQRLFERIHKEIKLLYERFVPSSIRQRRNIRQQIQPDTVLITVCILGKMFGFTQERMWHKFVVGNLFDKQDFPERSRFNRICRQLQGVIQWLRYQFTRRFVNQAKYTIIDSVPLPLCHSTRSFRAKRLQAYAGLGYCAAKKQHYYGFKGSFHVTDSGIIVGYVIDAASTHDVQITETLLEQSPHPYVLADKGYVSEPLRASLHRKGITLWALQRKKSKHPHPKTLHRWVRARRKQIETLFSGLCETLKLQQIRANSLSGYHLAIDSIVFAHAFLVHWALQDSSTGTRWKEQIFN
jgi:hypothetical protein